MRLSQIGEKELLGLTVAQKTAIVYGGTEDGGRQGEVALLLGSRPKYWQERAAAAARLYHEKRVRYIMPSGGVIWEYEGEEMTESEGLSRLLRGAGVPDEAILSENEARTTPENMIFGTLQIVRRLHLYNVHHVIVVTSPWHLRRGLALAGCYLPRTLTVSGCPAVSSDGSREHWFESAAMTERVDTEIALLKKLIDRGIIEDIEF